VSEIKAIRVLLADDHPVVMKGFASALMDYGFEVIGLAKTPSEAISLFQTLCPDVLVIDIRFGETQSGLHAAKKLLEIDKHSKIVFLTQCDQDVMIKEAYRLGAKAFITKDCDPADLATAVTAANKGEIFFLPHIAERLANLAIRGDTSPQSLLDPREIETFRLMALGHTNVEIINILNLSARTVSLVSQKIKDKLGIDRPAEITRLAVKHGLIDP